MSVYREWIAKGTKKPGKSRAGLAKAITEALRLDPPMSRTTIYKIIAGTREIHASELEPASRYMEEPIPRIADLIVQADHTTVPIIGNLHVGVWLDPDVQPEPLGTIVIPKDHVYPDLPHLAFVMKDDSMDAIRIFEGDIVVCVGFKEARVKLVTGMKVVIERKNTAGLIERTLRAVEVHNGGVEYKSLCTGKEYKSIALNKAKTSGERITVLGILRRSMREF